MLVKSIRYFLLAILLTLAPGLYAQEIDQPFMKFMHHPWVDSVFNSLSWEEKIGQLIWIDAQPDNDIEQAVRLNDAIKKAGPGGIIFSDGQAVRLAEMVNYFQKISKVPLLIAECSESGPGMKLTGIERYPDMLTLGAIQNDSLFYQMGIEVGKQFRRIGLHVNLYSQNLAGISERINKMYFKGLQDNGIISVAKQYPMSLRNGMGITESVKDPEIAVKEISDSIRKGLISQADIDAKCRRVLAAKYWAGLSRIVPVSEENLQDELTPASTKALIRDLYSNALTVLNNKGNIIPVKNMQDIKIAMVAINPEKNSNFQERVLSYMPADTFSIEINPFAEKTNSLRSCDCRNF
jgi:beta-glucosidase-like glycosyl hydrolase